MPPEPPPSDAVWMRRALDLAKLGEGRVEPNPMVGAVVVGHGGVVVGEGFHQQFGGPHAEVHALAQAGPAARGGTLYVTLEPCCHTGKTPPCTGGILAAGVARVVAAVRDPFPRVDGGGFAELERTGVAVEVGVEEDAARRLLAPYLKRTTTGRPWVIGKWAMSLDGRIATGTGESKWISSPESRAEVQTLRGRVDAIVVGRKTVLADDPLLTARPPGPRTAARVVLTASGDLPAAGQLFDTARAGPPVLLVTTPAGADNLTPWEGCGAEIIVLADTGAKSVLAELGRRGMTNILVEGGSQVLGAFADAGELDEAWVFVAPKLIGGAGPSPVGGIGVERLADSAGWELLTVSQRGPDVWLGTRRAAPGG